MDQKINRTALTNALIAAAAGAAGALLFLLAARGTFAGMMLSYFAPLPPMIATLAFGLAAGAVAVLVGAVLAGVFASPIIGLTVGAGMLLPAYLTSLAGLRAPAIAPDDRRASRIVIAAMIFAALSAIAVLASLIAAHGGATNARAALISAVVPMLRSVVQDSRLPAGLTAEELARAIVGVAPAIIAASSFFMLVCNSYIAGRVALISGQLQHPWPQISDSLALPGAAAGLFAVACGLVFLGGVPGVVASVVATALGCGFALQGLAVIHAVTRQSTIRMGLLFALYALILCLPPWPLIPLALVGFVDAAFHLRRRQAAALSSKTES